MKAQQEIIRNEDVENLQEQAATKFYDIIISSPNKGPKAVGLVGGRSVRGFFKKVYAHKERLTPEQWKTIHFFWCDERITDNIEETNYKVAKDTLLDALTSDGLLPEENVHVINYETTDVDGEVKKYKEEFEHNSNGIFDIIILGAGEDCHVASLFPDHILLTVTEPDFLSLDDSPKPPDRRITVSPGFIMTAKYAFLFFIGEGKKDALDMFFNPTLRPKNCPAKLVNEAGKSYVYTDIVE